MAGAVTDRLAARLRTRELVLAGHLEREQDQIAHACLAVARAVARGGVVISAGTGAAVGDAARAASSFLHPGGGAARRLPAAGPATHPDDATRVARLGRPDDVALAFAHGPADPGLHAFLEEAGARGLLRIALVGPGGRRPDADHVLLVDSEDRLVVQETQQTVCQMLVELVHLFLARPGLLDDACITCGDIAVAGRVVALGGHGAVIARAGGREEVAVDLVDDVAVGEVLLCHAGVALERLPGDADVPAGEQRSPELESVLDDVRDAVVETGAATIAQRRGIDVLAIEVCAHMMRARLDAGARLLVLADDRCALAAQDLAADALQLGWPALALVGPGAGPASAEDELMTLGRHGDIVLAISAGGLSSGIVAALQAGHRRGMPTCAIAGHDADVLADVDWLDKLFVVLGHDAPLVPPMQATIYHLLLEAIGGRA